MEGQEEAFCETEFVRVGLSFWTGHSADIFDDLAPFDCHTAASVGDLEYVASLPGGDLDTPNSKGWTPMMYAAYHGHAQLVTHFLSRNCRTRVCNKVGRSPLMLASMCGNIDVVHLLLSRKEVEELVVMVDRRNMTALSHAVHWGHLQAAENLLKAGSSPDTTEHSRGYSLLMLAASEGNAPMVEILLRAGALPQYQTVLGDTAVTVAQAKGHDSIAKFIAKFGQSRASYPSSLDGPARAELLMKQQRLGESQTQSLTQLLRQLGLEKYDQVFKDNEIDLPLFTTLTDEELKEVGITLLGPRRKLTAAISRINSQKKIID